MTPPLLELSRIAKTYPGVRALRGVDFALQAGEVHALLGENGAGKSTLIKIIAGIETPDAGAQIRVNGALVEAANPRLMQSLGIAVVYQTPTLFEQLSVAENLRIGENGFLVDPRAQRALAITMLSRIGANLSPDTPVCNLGMAEKQLLEIARAVHRDSKILVLDEPTASLSQEDAQRLLSLVERLKSEGVGILYISHRLEEIIRIADRFTVLRDGALVGTHLRGDMDREGIVRLMAGRESTQAPAPRPAPTGGPIIEVTAMGCTKSGVHDATLKLFRGEIVGLAGLVGAGRTELARSLFGVTPATSGEIRIDGIPVSILTPRDAIGHGIAYVPEDRKAHGVVEDLPIAQNISLSSLRRLGGSWLDDAKEADLADSFAAKFAIKAPSIHTVTRTLSGGNQQKVALARWLATHPRVLILDEPTQGIDIGTKAEIHRLIRELAGEGMAILLISSELPELLSLADRVLVMRQGGIVGELARADATRERVLELAMELAS